ncbi:hypothetical protein NQ318_006681 [Aromia moschata]|uniref:Integrase p58-like C-terminal domain-containing protein n=1 Tax=Aromia moschata TaxID=1265417 RepID=A0AAV8YT30_9CUCU|nr:hypothetical protein NQ318_006681 [Aromia moschata]
MGFIQRWDIEEFEEEKLFMEKKRDSKRTKSDDRRTVRKQNDDGKRTEKRQRGDIRKFVVEENKEEMKRKLEDTKRQVQREILERIKGLGHQLHRQALEILQSIPEEQQNDYDRIVGALEIRYGHKYLRQVYQSQIKSRQQRSNESLQEYDADIERLVHLAYPQAPKEFLEQIGIQTFIDRLVSVSKISSDERSLVVHGYLDDKWCPFIIHTGATRTILRSNILPKSPKDDCILGLDILSKHGFIVDIQNRIIQIQNEEIVLAPKLQNYNQSRRIIIIEEDIQIPQGSENIVIAKLDGNGEGLSTAIVEASEWNDGLLVARSLLQMNNQIPEISRYGTTIKGYWAQWNSLCLRDGLLHRKWESPDGVSAVYQLVLPKARIHQVLEELHSSPTGGHFGLPTDLILDRPLEENHERSLPEFVDDLRERMDRIHEFAREKLKMQSDKMKQRLDTTSTGAAFEPADAVWLYAPKRTKGRSPKLQRNWDPYTIIRKINDQVYCIQLSPRSKPKVVHLERLARYTGHDPPDWFVVEDPPPRTEDSVIRDE